MKNKLVFLLVVICVSLFNTCLFAQEKGALTLDLLQNKNWTMCFPSKKEYTLTDKFGLNTWTSVFLSNDENFEIKVTYCLSNSADISISPSKREKLKMGKYIISENRGEIKAYEILKLTSDSLVLKNLDNSSILTYFSKAEK